MSPPRPSIFSDRPILTDWEAHLEALHPKNVWVAHLFLHRIEACVRVNAQRSLSRFEKSLLRDISSTEGGSSLQDVRLERRLRHDFHSWGLIEPTSDGWKRTPHGDQALGDGYPHDGSERRRFDFVERDDGTTRFLCVDGLAVSATPSPEEWRFDPACLEACASETDSWKEAHGFPKGVVGVVRLDTSKFDWRHILIDDPHEALLLVARTGDDRLAALSLDSKTWKCASEPIEVVGPSAWETLLESTTTSEKSAWLEWCRQQGVANEVGEACEVDAKGMYLDVRLSDEAREGLDSKGESWVLETSGLVRRAWRLRFC